MIPTLLTVAIAWTRVADFLEAVGARIAAWFRTDPHLYTARHRKGGYFSPYVDWAQAQMLRAAVWFYANPVDPAWNGPTLSQFLPDDENAPHITYGPGSSHYGQLRPSALRLHAKTAVRLRAAAPPVVDITDDMYAEATS